MRESIGIGGEEAGQLCVEVEGERVGVVVGRMGAMRAQTRGRFARTTPRCLPSRTAGRTLASALATLAYKSGGRRARLDAVEALEEEDPQEAIMARGGGSSSDQRNRSGRLDELRIVIVSARRHCAVVDGRLHAASFCQLVASSL